MQEVSPLHAFFAKHVDAQFGVIPELCKEASTKDHIVSVLEEFSAADEAYRISTRDGHPITTMQELLADADPVYGTAPSFDYERRRRVYIGDLILFFVGVYPEGVRRHPLLKHDNEDRLRNIARESYFIASQFNLFEYEKEAPIFATLAERFDRCEYGLYLVRQSINQGSTLRLGDGRA